jgi:lysophospholipase L1-like esterase
MALASTLIATIPSWCAETDAPSSHIRPIYLVTIGDSHTENGIYTTAVFQYLTERGLATKDFNSYGFSGKTADDLISMITSKKIGLLPDPKAENLAIIMIGTNGYSLDGLKRLVEIVINSGFKVVILTTPPRRGPDTRNGSGGPGSNQAYNNDIRRIYPPIQFGYLQTIQVVDIVPPLLDPAVSIKAGEWTNPKYNSDGVHLNQEGYKQIGETVGQALREAISGGDTHE